MSSLKKMMTSDVIIGIDPSYTRTGLCKMTLSTGKTQFASVTKEENAKVFHHSDMIKSGIKITEEIVRKVPENSLVCIEYPVFATASGSYLAYLYGCIITNLLLKNPTIICVPPNAIKSLTKYESKEDLVRIYQKETGAEKRNHDEVTGYYLCKLARKILDGEYKNTYFII